MSNPHDGDDHLFSGDLNLVGDRILSSSDTARHHQQASFSFPRDNITNTPSWLLQTPTIAVQSQPAEELQDWVLAMNPETGTRASTGAAAHSSHPGTNPIISSNFDVNARGQLQQYSSGLEQHFSFGLNPGMSQQSPNSSLIAGRRDPGNNESVSHVLPPTLYSAQTGTMENLNNTLLASGPILDADLSARATLVTSSSGWPRGQTNFVQAPPIGAVVGAQLVGPTNGLMPMSRYEMEPTGPGFEQLDYGQYLPPPGNQPLSFAAGLRNQVTRAAQAAPPGLSNPRYTADPFDPMSLLNADHLKDFPYVATPEVANEASRPDIVVADDADEEGPALPARGAQGTTGLRRLGKKHNERLRRDAFKTHLQHLTRQIPGLEHHSETRKSVLMCTREYIQQLQARERRLRSQLMAFHLREQVLVASLLRMGASVEDIAAVSAAGNAGPFEVDNAAAVVEALLDPSRTLPPGNQLQTAGPSAGSSSAGRRMSVQVAGEEQNGQTVLGTRAFP